MGNGTARPAWILATEMTAPKRLGGSNKLITVQQLAERWQMSADTIYGQWREWNLTAIRIGRHLRFRERDIDAYEERSAEVGKSADRYTPPTPIQVARRRTLTRQEEANWKSSQVSWTCPCGRTVRGNGGRASHLRACARSWSIVVEIDPTADSTLYRTRSYIANRPQKHHEKVTAKNVSAGQMVSQQTCS